MVEIRSQSSRLSGGGSMRHNKELQWSPDPVAAAAAASAAPASSAAELNRYAFISIRANPRSHQC